MRAFIVDDERLARLELRLLLTEKHPDIEIAGEAEDAEEAILKLDDLLPDLLFLDIEMPDKSGFELLQSLQNCRVTPKIIFVTAFDHYALKAFDFGATDYLVKPIDPRRLAKSLGRLERISSGHSDDENLARLQPIRVLTEGDQVFVRDGPRCFLVRVSDIRLVESEGNYSRLIFGAREENSALVLRTLNSLESRLDPLIFFRASRRYLINLNCVMKVEPWFGGSLSVVMSGGQKIEMSRRQAQRLQEAMRL